MKSCNHCRSWRDCTGKPWYEIKDITFCRFQVSWVITEFLTCWSDWYVVMRDTWPSDPRQQSGYTEAPPTQHAIKATAPFERPLQVVAEVRNRLEKTNGDGRELVLMLTGRKDYELSTRARNALYYCSGWRRKDSEYSQWLAGRDWRRKHYEKPTVTMITIGRKTP